LQYQSSENDAKSDIAVLNDASATKSMVDIGLLQNQIEAQRGETQALRAALTRAQAHSTRVDDLLTESRQRLDVVSAELEVKRALADGTNRLYEELRDTELPAVQAQLKEKTVEVSRLKKERSAATLLVPEAAKTEEDYSRDVRELNQKIVDLAHQMVKRDEATKSASGSLRQKRDMYQDWCVDLLWCEVFSDFCPGLDYTCASILEKVASKIPPLRKRS
jgi:chromosome segregation ATPase